ncbi:MAG: transposase [Acaryochloridaceae cyanobacterium RL_2_7]|nr:transposase [Acaryochloridaceae cyanobacterium RL_2_7]
MVKGLGRAKQRREKLEQAHDRLRDLNQMVPWQIFSGQLASLTPTERKSNAGRKAIDSLLLFKMLVLQQLYNLSDEQTEYQSHDRASLRRFLGLGPEDEVPDAKTLWLFRQKLTKVGLIEELFAQFEEFLNQAGYTAQGEQIIDATLIPVPIQRNTREENEQIKRGEIPEIWNDNPHQRFQKIQMHDRARRITKATLAIKITSVLMLNMGSFVCIR